MHHNFYRDKMNGSVVVPLFLMEVCYNVYSEYLGIANRNLYSILLCSRDDDV
jgi:hypothetical protein